MAGPAAASKVQVGRTSKFSVLDAKGSKVKHVAAAEDAGERQRARCRLEEGAAHSGVHACVAVRGFLSANACWSPHSTQISFLLSVGVLEQPPPAAHPMHCLWA